MDFSSGDHNTGLYSVDNLLDLKTSLPIVICAIKKINKEFDIDTIFRLPNEAFRHPERFTCGTEKLAELANIPKALHPSRRQDILSSEDSGYHTRSDSSQNHDSRHLQWNLRRRESSDRSSQPHSAPTGLAAQQSENFQRFYRAVVSPTHVRVTAGGRIVPNTRALAPPAYEWNSEKFHFEPKESLNGNPVLQQAPIWAQSHLPAGVTPMAPVGYLSQYGLVPQGNTLGLSAMAAQVAGSLAATEQISCEGDLPKSSEPIGFPSSVALSHPAQFDPTKPFQYGGKMIVPANFQAPPQALPFNVLGNSNFVQSPIHSPPAYFPASFGMQMPNMQAPFSYQPPQAMQMSMPMPLQIPMPMQMANGSQPAMPVPGTVPVSDLARFQINNWGNQLKILDYQLASKNPMLNEGYLMAQRATVLSHLEKMEELLAQQLLVEKETASGKEGQASDGAMHRAGTSRDENTIIQGISSISSVEVKQPGVVSSVEKPSLTTTQDDALIPKPIQTKPRAESKSRLSAAAAMAPPFRPRVQPMVSQVTTVTGFSQPPPTEPALDRPHMHLGNKTLGYQEHQAHGHRSGYSSLSRASTLYDTPAQDHTSGLAPTFQRSHTFHGDTAALASLNASSVISPNAVPYLVGTIPSGVAASEAGDRDVVYPRALTEDEIRARCLYWGKAPRHVHMGLPKFDGKDFYPPSPVKEFARLATKQGGRLPIPEFNSLFTERGAPGYKSPEPVLPSTSTDNALVLHRPLTPPHFLAGHSPGDEDFSGMFSERGEAGYKSPTPPCPMTKAVKIERPSTPRYSDSSEDMAREAPNRELKVGSIKSVTESEASTVEIHLTPQKNGSLKGKSKQNETPFAERVANFNSEQQTLFLQNMLKNTATMSGPALSGGVSAATAQGYLPHYRGSATASLAPAITNGAAERTGIQTSNKHVGTEDVTTGPENRPLNRAIPIVRPSADSLDAEGYMRYLQKKSEEEKKLPGWTGSVTGTGPVIGGNW